MSNSGKESLLILGSNLSAVLDGPGLLGGLIIVACSSNSLVGIGLLLSNAVIHNVEEGKVHEAAIASLVAI